MIDGKTVKQVFRYGVMGFSGVLIDAVVYSLLLHLGFALTTAKTIGILASIVYAFIGNTLWTFASKISLNVLMRFTIVYATSFVANVITNSIVVQQLLHKNNHALQLAFLCATAVSIVITFSGLKLWVYRQ